MNAYEKIPKNILLFQHQLKKKLDNGKTIAYKLKFVNSLRFMTSKLSDLVDNLSEIYKKECKGCMERKEIKSTCKFIELKNNKLRYKCIKCNKIWLKPVKELIKKFSGVYKFCNGDINKFVLLLGKDVYPYEYIHG